MQLFFYLRSTYLLLILIFLLPTIANAIDTSRPGPKDKPIEVKIGFYVVDVDDLIDADQSFKANVYYSAEWYDKRLVKEGQTTKYSINEVWHPNIQIINRQRSALTLPEIVEVDPDGKATYKQRIIGSFSQPLYLKKFPFDKQKLTFQIIAVAQRKDNVKLTKGLSGIADYFSIPNWDVIKWDYKTTEYNYLPDTPPAQGLVFSVSVKRFYNFYLYKFIIPLFLIVFMSWMVFWIDPEDYSTQISVSITSMLTLITYQFLVGNTLPQVTYLTLLDKLMVFSTALVFISFLEVILTTILFKTDRATKARNIDKYCRIIFPAVFIVAIITQFFI